MTAGRRMVRELRFAQWEAHQPLPRMKAQRGAQQQRGPNSHWWAGVLAGRAGGLPDAPDLRACILHQKLQMLDCCIFLSRHPDGGFITLNVPAAGPPSGGALGTYCFSWQAVPQMHVLIYMYSSAVQRGYKLERLEIL